MRNKIAGGSLGLALCAVLIQGCASGVNQERSEVEGMSSFVTDSSSERVVVSIDDECVRTIYWHEDNAVVECNSSAKVAAPAAAPVKKVGSSLVSYNGRALFEFDSAQLTTIGKAELDRLTGKLNSQDKIKKIEIVGHADSVGSESYNLILSEKRAQSVKSYLQQSLRSVAVTARGMGENAPIADNSSENGRRLNRRVDVDIAAMVER